MANIKHYIPKDCYLTVYDIDYNKLYSEGKRIILFDLDNTLAPYDQFTIDDKIITFFNQLIDIGFKIAIISNNKKNRLETFLNGTKYLYVHYALKPLRYGYNKMYKLLGKPDKSTVITIGDQMLTDCLGSNRFGFDSLLVKSIKRKNERWYTKINRKRSKRILEKIKKIDNEAYLKIKKVDEE